MKVLVLASWYPSPMWEDLGDFVEKQVNALNKNGIETDVIYPNIYSPKRILKCKKISLGIKKDRRNNNSVYIGYGIKTHLNSFDSYRTKRLGQKLFKLYVKENGLPDIIHLHNFMAGDLAVWIKNKYGIPYIVTEHYTGFARNIVTPFEKKIAGRVFENSSRNIAVSEPFRKILEDVTNKTFITIPNLIDTDYFIPGGSKFDHYTFINVADVVPKKNQQLLLRAISKLVEKGLDIRCIFVGDGPDKKGLENLAVSLGIDRFVTFTGFKPRSEVKTLLQKSHCFVLPSLHETFGIVVIEALAAGIPVIATPSGGPEWILKNSNVGQIIDWNIEELTQAMEDWMTISINSDTLHSWVVDNYSDRVICQSLKKLYKEVLDC
ncbi:glycosyltransferase family 4 protein [Thiospirochaeta perfilievii]|uniref:Glycosyltransferase family 4 protein n=1 Tax=Thiospirochaeta perfilievii TaxID=252967 RepID=A0A5C1QF21_9SPIO|nr:glycosyltransferase [Thiospirochaeta perfilievii]QEN05680.1 glycosyltransferase family 4 protein [Thiospirochaeta perfilievii]